MWGQVEVTHAGMCEAKYGSPFGSSLLHKDIYSVRTAGNKLRAVTCRRQAMKCAECDGRFLNSIYVRGWKLFCFVHWNNTPCL